MRHIFITFLALTQPLNFGFCCEITSHPNWHLLDYDICGESSTNRIIGGKEAALGQYPWLARLGFIKQNMILQMFFPKLIFRCGGSLINHLYVLTASHCVAPSKLETLVIVRLGENNADSDQDCDGETCAPPVQDIKIEKIISHHNYQKPLYRNDIALIRLEHPVRYHDFVSPICLPYNNLCNKNQLGQIMEVAGWGIHNIYTGQASNKLLTVKVPIVDLKKCINGFNNLVHLGAGQMCAGGQVGKDSCGGDSGGPLMAPDAVTGLPKYFIFGIVSFGDTDCGSHTPAVYTNVSHYMPWILNNIEP